MEKKLEICKLLTISTAHITPELGEELNESSIDNTVNPDIPYVVYNKDDYGWWIHVTNVENLNDVNPILRPAIDLAMSNDCEWLCLDCNGDIVDGIPTYKWL